jgi:signal peptidase II
MLASPSPSAHVTNEDRRRQRLGRRRRFVLACLVALIVTLIDQGTKALAITQLSDRERIPLMGELFGLQLAFNPGTVMSLGSTSTWVFTVVGTVATVALLFAAIRVPSRGWALALGFVWGGAIGNLLDRYFAAPGFGRGHVTDFLAYGSVFIGNIADVALGIGVGLGILQFVRTRLNPSADERPPVDAPGHD